MNDLVNCTNDVHKDNQKLFKNNCKKCGTVPSYADDSTYMVATTTRFQAQQKIIDNVAKIKRYLDSNSMSINLSKTEILETMVRQKQTRILGNPPQLSITKPDGSLKVITAAVSCRLLGANLNEDMTWRHHLELGEKALLPAVRLLNGALKHIAGNIPKKSRLLLANGLVLSRILYMIPMWGGMNSTDSRKLQSLLNSCARMITGLSRRTRTRTLMTECNWLYIGKLVKLHSLLAMCRIVRRGTPYNLSVSVSLDEEDKISTNRGRIQLVRRSFKWRTVEDWNSLSQELHGNTSYLSFKRGVRKYLVDSRLPIVNRVRPVNWD